MVHISHVYKEHEGVEHGTKGLIEGKLDYEVALARAEFGGFIV